jgi:hypothetical protein
MKLCIIRHRGQGCEAVKGPVELRFAQPFGIQFCMLIKALINVPEQNGTPLKLFMSGLVLEVLEYKYKVKAESSKLKGKR